MRIPDSNDKKKGRCRARTPMSDRHSSIGSLGRKDRIIFNEIVITGLVSALNKAFLETTKVQTQRRCRMKRFMRITPCTHTRLLLVCAFSFQVMFLRGYFLGAFVWFLVDPITLYINRVYRACQQLFRRNHQE
jgi:hypothetical protein